MLNILTKWIEHLKNNTIKKHESYYTYWLEEYFLNLNRDLTRDGLIEELTEFLTPDILIWLAEQNYSDTSDKDDSNTDDSNN